MDILINEYKGRLRPDRLRRFFFACNEDLDGTRAMIDKHLVWRKEHKVDEITEFVRFKPFLLGSNPHATELKARGLGLVDCVVNAGRCRFGTDVVHIEIMGKESQNFSESDPIWLAKVVENYIGFFERRNLLLEELSVREQRFVRAIQIRDVAQMNWMPGGSALSMVRQILNLGMNNYPECGSCAIFLNPPRVFEKIFTLVKPWLPKGLDRKVKFLSGERIHMQLMKHVRPSSIIALQRLTVENEDGDEITKSLALEQIGEWEKTFEVTDKSIQFLYFELKAKMTEAVTWYRITDTEDEPFLPTSGIKAKIAYVRRDQRPAPSYPDDVALDTCDIPGGQQYAVLPHGVDEALLVLQIDRAFSWLVSRKFRIRIIGQGTVKDRINQVHYLMLHWAKETRFRSLVLEVSEDVTERFLNANDQDVLRTCRHLRRHLIWRAEAPHIVYGRSGSELENSLMSRNGDLMHVESWEQIMESDGDDDGVIEARIALHERQRRFLAQHTQGRMIISLIDVAGVSLNSRSTKLLKQLLELEFEQYPGTTRGRILRNASKAFQHQLKSLLKLYPDISEPGFVKFVEGHEETATEFLRHLPAKAVVELGLLGKVGKVGDDCQHILVQAGESVCLFYALDETCVPRVRWHDLNSSESPKSRVKGKLMYICAPETGNENLDDVQVVSLDLLSSTVDLLVCAGPKTTEALLMLTLDHTASWIHPHQFALKVIKD